MTRRKPDGPKKPSEGVDVGLDITSTILKTLETAAKAAPVPGLSEAAKLALQITDTIKAVRANQEDFKRLAQDASQLVYVIIRTYLEISGEDRVDPNLVANLDHVLMILNAIEEFATKGASRNRFIAFWRSNVDAVKIAEHRQKLQQCLNKFGFESDITIRVMVMRLAAKHEQLVGLLDNRDPRNGNVMQEVETNDVRSRVPRPEKDAAVDRDPSNQHVSSSISIGSGANFSGAAAIAIGPYNKVHYQPSS